MLSLEVVHNKCHKNTYLCQLQADGAELFSVHIYVIQKLNYIGTSQCKRSKWLLYVGYKYFQTS